MFTEFKPFVVEPDGPEKKVVLRNPDDDKDFIVVYRSVSWEDTIGVCSRLNSMLNTHHSRHRTMDFKPFVVEPDGPENKVVLRNPDVYCDDDRDTIPGNHE